MYVAAKGGEQAIQNAEQFYGLLNGPLTLEAVRLIQERLPYLVDRVMGEGSLYSPELAALALAQTGGDLYEAVLLLRAYRATQPRIAYAQPASADRLLTVRRISASFKDIPGGQILGPSLDYSHRLLRLDVLDAASSDQRSATNQTEERAVNGTGATNGSHQLSAIRYPPEFTPAERPSPPNQPAVADWQRGQGLLPPTEPEQIDPAAIPDVTTDTVMFPAPRAHRLQALARADTGGTLALGYSVMRGYGMIHPTVNELRLGYAEVELTHPVTGAVFSAGRVKVSQCEVISPDHGEQGYMLGFAATLGWNEVKLIAASTLDMDMSAGGENPAHTEEFVMYHTEPVEASGFCIHFKLPHYVTFASGLDNIRKMLGAMGWDQGKTTETAAPAAESESKAEDGEQVEEAVL
ncbi:MAG: carbon-phosphorus lyase complex subunit PhnI [Anaerolineae bacterium]|nr:carbon-phosphorus lyase complex subunit PhnI [Anaerolineae bacterium]